MMMRGVLRGKLKVLLRCAGARFSTVESCLARYAAALFGHV